MADSQWVRRGVQEQGAGYSALQLYAEGVGARGVRAGGHPEGDAPIQYNVV